MSDANSEAPKMPEDPTAASPEERLFEAARSGDLAALRTLLEADPARLHARAAPYEWTLLHAAANEGRLAAVELLLARGLDPNVREKGDDSYAMHWAAADGHLDIVRRLADAGGDVVGQGDDHQLEVIGWATCWPGGDDAAHRAIADFLVSRGARHHMFSAIALELADEVRRLVASDPGVLERPMSHNENFQRPLHFAVRLKRRAMVALLLELGADPLGKDGSGFLAPAYAMDPDIARPILAAIRARQGALDVASAVGLGEWQDADALLRAGAPSAGALHLMARQNNLPAVRWLLERGADPNGLWAHWDADVTPLHLAVMMGHADAVRLLVAAGADPRIRDSKHGADAVGWADYFGRQDLVELLRAV